jgi:hypothetical protein
MLEWKRAKADRKGVSFFFLTRMEKVPVENGEITGRIQQ